MFNLTFDSLAAVGFNWDYEKKLVSIDDFILFVLSAKSKNALEQELSNPDKKIKVYLVNVITKDDFNKITRMMKEKLSNETPLLLFVIPEDLTSSINIPPQFTLVVQKGESLEQILHRMLKKVTSLASLGLITHLMPVYLNKHAALNSVEHRNLTIQMQKFIKQCQNREELREIAPAIRQKYNALSLNSN